MYTEFKELRKKWRQEKKEAEEAEREREREAIVQVMATGDMRHPHHQQRMVYDPSFVSRQWMSIIEPSPDLHGDGTPSGPHPLSDHSYTHSATQGQAVSAVQTFENPPQMGSLYGSLRGAGTHIDARYGLPSPAQEVGHFRHPAGRHLPQSDLPSLSIPHRNPEEDMYYCQGQITLQGGLGWGDQHPSQRPQHGVRPPHQQQQFYGAQENTIHPPAHSLDLLTVPTPNPSPLLGGGFPSLGPRTGPVPDLEGDVGLSMVGAGRESTSLTPVLTAHVSLGSNRLPPDSILLTPLAGYEPDGEQQLNTVSRSREQFHEFKSNEFDSEGAPSGRDRERCYTVVGNRQGNGRKQKYE